MITSISLQEGALLERGGPQLSFQNGRQCISSWPYLALQAHALFRRLPVGKVTEGPGCAKVARILKGPRWQGRIAVTVKSREPACCAARAPDEPPAATDARTEACAAAKAGPVISGLTGKFRVG